MVTGNNYRFGHKVWVDILVEASEAKPELLLQPPVEEPVDKASDFIAEAVADVKASNYPSIDDVPVECADKEGDDDDLYDDEPSASSTQASVSNLMTPKQVYDNKCEEVKDNATRKALTDLFELGFVSFDVNKAMLSKYNNDVQVVAGFLCEGVLSESCIDHVFK